MAEFDILGSLEANFNSKPISIVEFAESKKFCNRTLYPRQKLLLKLIFLEDLTDLEEAILDEWLKGGRGGEEVEICQGIREKREWLKANGYKHFREVALVGGRRCSKGFITGLSLAKKVYDTIQLQDPGRHYGIDADKEIFFSCVAASQDQAKEMQYADFSAMVHSCQALQRNVFKLQETEFSVMTETDMRKLAEWKRQGRRVQRDISTIRGKALPANSRTIRGSAAMAIVFDEFAHFMQGESDQSDNEVYAAAIPSLGQFGRDAMLFCNPPESPVWMADLSFKQIGDIQIGDKVVGWHRSEGKTNRDLCEATVLNVIRRKSPLVKVTMESGRTFRCTPDHRWLTLSSGGGRKGGEWYAPAKVGRKLAHVVDTTPELDSELIRDAAWLGGMFDGEGYAARGRQLTIAQSREVNPKVCEQIERVLNRLGFQWIYHPSQSKSGPGGAYHVLGGKQELVNFANWTQPVQLHKLVAKAMTGRWRREDKIVSVEPDGESEVIALTTTTVNYICNGYASRNCNSSPYSKTGKFFQRFEVGMEDGSEADEETPGGANAILSMRFPSWSLYEGWWQDPTYKGPKKCITVSPDWSWQDTNEDDTYFYTEDDRMAIIQMQQEEKDDPQKFKVERRGHFAEVIDAYLIPEMVDRMFEGYPTWDDELKAIHRREMSTNWDNPSWPHVYHAHLDPSSTTAGFGFAMGHAEDMLMDGRSEVHVLFDIIKRWNPKEFEDGVIDWEPILEEVLFYCNVFRPKTLTMDQHQTVYPMQWLKKEFRKRGIETRVWEKTPNARTNWNRAEIFRTAAYRDLIHAPNDTADAAYCALELKFLQEVKSGMTPRVEKQDEGPVQTKDMADCVMEVTESCIGNTLALEERESLASGATYGAPGGYRLGGFQNSERGAALSAHYARRSGEQSFRPGGRSSSPSPERRPFGGRPVPRRFPGW